MVSVGPTETVDLYLRKSTVDNGRSVAGQHDQLKAGARDEGLMVGRVFTDPDLSASRFARKPRPDYAELLVHIRDGSCRVLGLWESSRGSRDLGEWVALLDLCRAKGTRIWVFTHRRVYDLSRRRDWRTLAEEGIDSADESEKIAERTQRGKRMAAAAGRPAGRLVYGFVREYDERGAYVRRRNGLG
jgi:site-specific DNA recombinase